MVHGPVREVVRGPSPLDWSTDRGPVFSGHPDRTAILVTSSCERPMSLLSVLVLFGYLSLFFFCCIFQLNNNYVLFVFAACLLIRSVNSGLAD